MKKSVDGHHIGSVISKSEFTIVVSDLKNPRVTVFMPIVAKKLKINWILSMWTSYWIRPRVKKRVSERISPRVMHIIRSETLGETICETLGLDSRRDSLRFFSRAIFNFWSLTSESSSPTAETPNKGLQVNYSKRIQNSLKYGMRDQHIGSAILNFEILTSDS